FRGNSENARVVQSRGSNTSRMQSPLGTFSKKMAQFGGPTSVVPRISPFFGCRITPTTLRTPTASPKATKVELGGGSFRVGWLMVIFFLAMSSPGQHIKDPG